MKMKLLFLSAVVALSVSSASGQEPEFRRHFIGSSSFMLANLLPNPPAFYQLNYGYWLSRKDVLSLEAITWRYFHPLGIPYGPSFEAPEEAYPGSVRAFGMGLAYQRFWWKGLYTAAHATPFLQQYLDPQKQKIKQGFQLFTVLRLGYHVKLFRNRFFVEPSVAATHWPINTGAPESFAQKDRGWPNYFLVEPGLHFGVKF